MLSAQTPSRLDRQLAHAGELHRLGQLEQAQSAYREILAHAPDHTPALGGLGACLAQRGQLHEAIDVLRRAALGGGSEPAAAIALANLGNALQECKRDDEALAAFDRALALMPMHLNLKVNRANLLVQMARTDEAMAGYDDVLQRDAANLRALIGRGSLLSRGARHRDALAAFDRALQFAPRDPVALYNRGVVLLALDRLDESAQALRLALAVAPHNADAHLNLGLVLKAQGDAPAALRQISRALQLRPDWPDALTSQGHLLHSMGDFAAALASYDAALRLHPGVAGTQLTRADALRCLGRYAQANLAYEAALALAPDHPDHVKAHINWASCLLLCGHLRSGWEQYEWRWGDAGLHPPHPYGLEQLWLGKDDPAGKTVLLHAEQGYGDTLQFCRYAPLLARRGARVLLQVPHALQRLLQSLDGVHAVLRMDEDVPAFDLHTPLLSLPLAFATDIANIPAQLPYLRAPESDVARWQLDLGQSSRPRIGIAWSGNPAHANDALRSTPLHAWEPLLESGRGRVDWICLQKAVAPEDRPYLAQLGVRDPSEELGDFCDTAALVQNLDLVISVDTALAHLAGALGVPLFVLLPANPDWRWMLERSDSPWYPGARLFRQSTPGNWGTVMQSVTTALEQCRHLPAREI